MSEFYLDVDPVKAAECYIDEDLETQIQDIASILSGVHRRGIDDTYGYVLGDPVEVDRLCLYKEVWDWNKAHGLALCRELIHRSSAPDYICHPAEHIIFDAQRAEHEDDEEVLPAPPDEIIDDCRYAYFLTVDVDSEYTKREMPEWLVRLFEEQG